LIAIPTINTIRNLLIPRDRGGPGIAVLIMVYG
jgi:hypothetical protein